MRYLQCLGSTCNASESLQCTVTVSACSTDATQIFQHKAGIFRVVIECAVLLHRCARPAL